jgi:chromosome segregation ATPase
MDELSKLKEANRNLNLSLKEAQSKYNILSPQYDEMVKKVNSIEKQNSELNMNYEQALEEDKELKDNIINYSKKIITLITILKYYKKKMIN